MPLRKKSSFALDNINLFNDKMLNWLKQFNIFCLLQSNTQKNNSYQSYDWIAGINALEIIQSPNNRLEDLDPMLFHQDWHFGHLNYNLKNQIEDLYSEKTDPIGFQDFHFFKPEIICYLQKNILTIESSSKDPALLFQQIQATTGIAPPVNATPVIMEQRVSRLQYLQDIKNLQQHIQRGDCYEINYCMEFYKENTQADPFSVFGQLNKISANAFNAFYTTDQRYLICASPERYLKKTGSTLISQPIKGTIKRNLSNSHEDETLKQSLGKMPKEISENIMIVDLVRNDLSKICKADTVQVEELLGIYSFPQVHHLISTITGQLKEQTSFSEMIKACFPMGSMTGAPKKKVLELIESTEKTNRGLFSGAVGYIDPNGDFDFNVVIRSLQYNAHTQYLSYMVGSGITIYADPALEYEECMLKAKAMEAVLCQAIV